MGDIGKTLCTENCNVCPIITHPNYKMLTYLFNKLFNKFGEGVYDIVQEQCPNLTVCYKCRINDFCHTEGYDLNYD